MACFACLPDCLCLCKSDVGTSDLTYLLDAPLVFCILDGEPQLTWTPIWKLVVSCVPPAENKTKQSVVQR